MITEKKGQRVDDQAATAAMGEMLSEARPPSLAPIGIRLQSWPESYVKRGFMFWGLGAGAALTQAMSYDVSTARPFLLLRTLQAHRPPSVSL